MNVLDRNLQETRKADEAAPLVPPGEPTLWEQVAGLFRGRDRWLNLIALFVISAFWIFAIASAVRFFQADGTRSMIAWSMGFVLGLIVVTAGRMWFWMQIYKNAVVREVRQVQLQFDRLASRLERPE